ncbi:MAG: Stp1/IreP family PP2C-type Ser/Thr phosphatase [Clostridiales bacterium]|nr:Stp1/IreP family PP2C-type Ser/Thr phosphatase [Clostridiales bacterium]
MNFYGISDKGKVRQINQDVCLTYYDNELKTALLVVCDGMGGAKAGNIASAMAAEAYMDYMKSHLSAENNIIDVMQLMNEAIVIANKQVYDRSINDSECAGMGTTLVAAAVNNNAAVIANIGDSRAYHVTDSKITQITKDHSVVEDMIDRGDIKRSEAGNHPNRNLITRVVGTSADTEPDFFFVNLQNGERLLLCSDGLSNIISDQILFVEINSGTDSADICQRLIRLAVSKGAPDNVTAIVCLK